MIWVPSFLLRVECPFYIMLCINCFCLQVETSVLNLPVDKMDYFVPGWWASKILSVKYNLTRSSYVSVCFIAYLLRYIQCWGFSNSWFNHFSGLVAAPVCCMLYTVCSTVWFGFLYIKSKTFLFCSIVVKLLLILFPFVLCLLINFHSLIVISCVFNRG